MKVASLTLTLALALSLLARGALSQEDPVYKGCYASPGSLRLARPSELQSPEACRAECTTTEDQTAVALSKKTNCWCGGPGSAPPEQLIVDPSLCDAECPGKAGSKCGSESGMYYSVYLVGTSGGLPPPVEPESGTTNTTIEYPTTANTTTDDDASAPSQTDSTPVPTEMNNSTGFVPIDGNATFATQPVPTGTAGVEISNSAVGGYAVSGGALAIMFGAIVMVL